ncbi:hypothetical protein A3765_16730 [Oleiphilus sp. HI0130]|nr:hypothetical protein A3765_16730 [Oleiphilus sp. HI0130]
MRAQTGFAQSQITPYMSQVTDNTWPITLAVLFVLALIAAQASGVQHMLSNARPISTIDSNALHVSKAENAIETSSDAAIKVTWPSKTLNERIEQLNLKGRVIISAPQASPSIAIRTDLLFSEGDYLLSRAGKHTMNALFADLKLPATTTLELKERRNTEVEFTHGVKMQTLRKNRERSLTKYLSAFGLNMRIVQ